MGRKASGEHGHLSPPSVVFSFDLPSALKALSSVPALLTTTLRLLHFRRLQVAMSTTVQQDRRQPSQPDFLDHGHTKGVSRGCQCLVASADSERLRTWNSEPTGKYVFPYELNRGKSNTVDACLTWCSTYGYPAAGLENGDLCCASASHYLPHVHVVDAWRASLR